MVLARELHGQPAARMHNWQTPYLNRRFILMEETSTVSTWKSLKKITVSMYIKTSKTSRVNVARQKLYFTRKPNSWVDSTFSASTHSACLLGSLPSGPHMEAVAQITTETTWFCNIGMVRKRMKTARCFLHGVLPDATKLMHCYFTVDVPKLAGVIANVPNRSEMHTPLLMPRWIKKYIVLNWKEGSWASGYVTGQFISRSKFQTHWGTYVLWQDTNLYICRSPPRC